MEVGKLKLASDRWPSLRRRFDTVTTIYEDGAPVIYIGNISRVSPADLRTEAVRDAMIGVEGWKVTPHSILGSYHNGSQYTWMLVIHRADISREVIKKIKVF